MKYINAYWCVIFSALCNFFIDDGFVPAVIFMATAMVIIEIANKNISVTIVKSNKEEKNEI
ncbi:hypothetical protein [uncultured Tolumonas sp.]|uniref:hypothetical protein n=1 Tax=uncultured Tolumonas sp. TaxID=263765 RepID=UPI002A0A3CC2|nr:hypothetical protein [uncultured Tolumonas sp.]